MNTLLIIKYNLKICRCYRFPFVAIAIALPMILPMAVQSWFGSTSPIPILSNNYTFLCCVILIVMSQLGLLREIEINGTEFWTALPFSPMQIFLSQVGTRQAMFLLLFLPCLGILLLSGVVSWSWEILRMVTNIVICYSVTSLGVLCFWRPSASMSQTKINIAVLPLASSILIILVPVIALADYLGWWPTYVALAISFPLFFVLRSILREIEPLTGKRPLFAADVSCKPEPSQAKRSISEEIRESAIARVLGRYLSPVSRYIVTTVWMDFRYIYGISCITLMLITLEFIPNFGSGSTYWLVFICIASMFATYCSSTALHALSPLPIETRRLFFLLLGPFFVIFAFMVILPYCLGFHNTVRVKEWCYYDKTVRSPHRAYSTFPLDYDVTKLSLSTSDYRLYDEQAETPSDQPCKQGPRLNIVAKDFSDALWKQCHVQVLPQDLISYDEPFKVWKVSTDVPVVFRKRVENEMRVGWFVRTSLFFFFLLWMRIICSGGGLVDASQKKRSTPTRNAKSNALPVRQAISLKQWAERVVLWLGLGVVVGLFVSSAIHPFLVRVFSFKAFLLDHYLGCWIALLLGIYIFYRLSLQAFRRVYG